MTVDWSNWMNMSEAEQKALWARYRKILRDEIDNARYSNFARMNAAIYDPFRWYERFPGRSRL